MTEEELHNYTKWLMEVWNPDQLYIPFADDAPSIYLSHISKVKTLNIGSVNERFKPCSECARLGALYTESTSDIWKCWKLDTRIVKPKEQTCTGFILKNAR